MKIEIVKVICPHCNKEQKQGIFVKDGKEIITQNTCINCREEFLIHPVTRETTKI